MTADKAPGGDSDQSVSVVVPSFSMIAMLPDMLDSIAAQTHAPLECIVVDGSSDHTQEVVDAYARSDGRFSYIFN